MLKTSFVKATLCATVIAAGLASCGKEPDAKRPPAPATASPAPAAPAAAGGAVGAPHGTTLAEGIDFAKPGYPAFVKDVQGVSGVEAWGRWTDANLAPGARIRFDRPLPKAFTLELRLSALGPNASKPVKIRAGAVEKTVTIGAGGATSHRVEFAGVDGDTIEIVPPEPILPGVVMPGNPDTRKVGVGLISLRIQS